MVVMEIILHFAIFFVYLFSIMLFLPKAFLFPLTLCEKYLIEPKSRLKYVFFHKNTFLRPQLKILAYPTIIVWAYYILKLIFILITQFYKIDILVSLFSEGGKFFVFIETLIFFAFAMYLHILGHIYQKKDWSLSIDEYENLEKK